MCQLLGMNCNVPTDICFSFEGFHARGGLTDHHRDGFGVAFFEGQGCRVFLDSKSTIESPVADLVRRYPIHSKNVIAHIRKATQGKVELQNCHPFQRELWGRYWIFAHNGNLENFQPEGLEFFSPVGQTDSERAFCYLLDWLRKAFPQGHPEPKAVYAFGHPFIVVGGRERSPPPGPSSEGPWGPSGVCCPTGSREARYR